MVIIESKPKLEKVEIVIERYDGTKEIHTIVDTKIIKKDNSLKIIR